MNNTEFKLRNKTTHSVKKLIHLISLLSLVALPANYAFAQNGNRAGHHSMEPVVPEEIIPPAPILSVEESLASFTLAEGFAIEAVATEPLVEKPVSLTFDEDGHIWVVEMKGYMPNIDGKGEDIPQGKIVVLEDTNQDGSADKRTVFIDNLLLPRALTLVKDGIIFSDHTSLYYADREGTKRTSAPTIIDNNYAPSGNVEHRPNGLLRHIFRGQWGISMDNYGRIYHNSNSVLLRGDNLQPDLLANTGGLSSGLSKQISTNAVYPSRVNPGVNRAYIALKNGYHYNMLDPTSYKLINATAASGPTFYRGNQFPSEWRDVAFVAECSSNLVKAIRVKADGNSLEGEHVFPRHEFLTSNLADYYHGIIQHKTYLSSYLRDQYVSRGLDNPAISHGRIYRIYHKDSKVGPQPKLSQADKETLVATLSHPNGWWRDTAQRLLIEKGEEAPVEQLLQILNNDSSEIARIHALWTLEGLLQLPTNEELRTLLQTLATNNSHPQLQIHILTVAMDFPNPKERTAFAKKLLPTEVNTATNRPYLARLLTADPENAEEAAAFARKHRNDKFVPEAIASELSDQKRSEFPETGTMIDHFLKNYRNKQKIIPAEKRLSGKHLASFQRGRTLYQGSAACAGCHGADGQGQTNLGPPLDQSEWVTKKPDRLAKILLHGLTGPIEVNGIKYSPQAAMPGLSQNPTIKDENIADIMTYIRSEWSNQSRWLIPSKLVSKVRGATKDRAGIPYNVPELNVSE